MRTQLILMGMIVALLLIATILLGISRATYPKYYLEDFEDDVVGGLPQSDWYSISYYLIDSNTTLEVSDDRAYSGVASLHLKYFGLRYASPPPPAVYISFRPNIISDGGFSYKELRFSFMIDVLTYDKVDIMVENSSGNLFWLCYIRSNIVRTEVSQMEAGYTWDWIRIEMRWITANESYVTISCNSQTTCNISYNIPRDIVGVVFYIDGGNLADAYVDYFKFENTYRPTPPRDVVIRGYPQYPKIELEWKSPSYLGQGFSHYKIYRAVTDIDQQVYVYSFYRNVTGESFVDYNVSLNKKYHYYITAVNYYGESDASEEVSVTLLESRRIPLPPVKVRAEYRDGKVILTWEKPESSGGSPILKYKIYRGESEYQIFYYASVDADTYSFEDRNIESGKTYYYYVTAVNEIGESEPSKVVSVQIPSPEVFSWWIILVVVAVITGIVLWRKFAGR